MMSLERIREEGIVAVLRAESVEKCLQIARELYEGGIRVIEVTFTVPDADKAIKALSEEIKDALIGAGTVLTAEQCKRAIEAGAKYIVSPHLSEEINEVCKEAGIPYVPGIMTPTEYVKAKNMGCEVVKIFPGDVLKPVFIKSMKGPFPEFKAIPTGGVSLENLEEWFKAGAFAVGAGSNLVKGNPKENARQFVERIREIKKGSR
ncbi:MAG: bifunctional 4-hydroxy-2-oxoglutarate aldolase/2-dehydro-3-deoxy-phosphogluconate aldolase [Synergistetes bacterium]|nr:bifunctional 4-hydroxy-2-oxoglutarate aldolase/2-dehydro-3-deoxy-phosphogluconate aldolase [Synergistota bacterium]